MNELHRKQKILIVDDQDTNIKILTVLCRNMGYETIAAVNGREGVEAALQIRPDTILMDAMMPVMDGFEATACLKSRPETKHIPIIMVTALDSREDRLNGIAKGANDFLNKPIDSEELLLRLRNNLRNKEFHDFLENHNQILEAQVAERTKQVREGYIDTIRRLTLACEYRDDDTGAHVNRISFYTKELAGQLGMDREFSEGIYYASPMHDIGKVAIPDSVMLKPGPLTPEEWGLMKRHTEIGAQILRGSDSPLLKMAVDIALSHHERWDGSGYPQGLRGEAIPLTARIMNIADQYDALRSRRPYKPPFDHEKTCAIILQGDGRTQPEHFDPDILAAFKKTAAICADIFAAHQEE